MFYSLKGLRKSSGEHAEKLISVNKELGTKSILFVSKHKKEFLFQANNIFVSSFIREAEIFPDTGQYKYPIKQHSARAAPS